MHGEGAQSHFTVSAHDGDSSYADPLRHRNGMNLVIEYI